MKPVNRPFIEVGERFERPTQPPSFSSIFDLSKSYICSSVPRQFHFLQTPFVIKRNGRKNEGVTTISLIKFHRARCNFTHWISSSLHVCATLHSLKVSLIININTQHFTNRKSMNVQHHKVFVIKFRCSDFLSHIIPSYVVSNYKTAYTLENVEISFFSRW